ncbi:MAG: cupin domain-containing protein [Rubrivivax sp.]|nr:cupin domain-containing protein [Rubrivivax sp.]
MFVKPQALQSRHIRRAQYVSCDDAFIDVRLPGSSPKENYSIIGPGVTQNASQVINLREPHGFNIGAAGLQPGITNNLHLHFTAEVFIVSQGRITLRWGERGEQGEAVLEEGDVICLPPWIFRGFSNAGSGYAFVMTVLGGDDTGGIIWSPEVLRQARATGLVLSRDNQLIELQPDAPAPDEATLLQPMPAADVAALRRWSAAELLARAVRRGERAYRTAPLDAMLPGQGWQIAPFIGWGLTQHLAHRPVVAEPQGFTAEWICVPAGACSAPFVLDEAAALVHERGPLAVRFNGDGAVAAALGAGDTLSLPGGCTRQWLNTGTEPAHALLVVCGEHRKHPRFAPEVASAAAALDWALDAGAHLAKRSLLPPGMLG